MKHPSAVTACNLDLENLVTDSNRSIATLAITTLLKTGSEGSIDRLMKQISSFMSEISDEFKVHSPRLPRPRPEPGWRFWGGWWGGGMAEAHAVLHPAFVQRGQEPPGQLVKFFSVSCALAMCWAEFGERGTEQWTDLSCVRGACLLRRGGGQSTR